MYQPIKMKDVQPSRSESATMAEDDLRNFLDATFPAGKIRVPDGMRIERCTLIYRRAAQRLQLPVIITQRVGSVYMIKE